MEEQQRKPCFYVNVPTVPVPRVVDDAAPMAPARPPVRLPVRPPARPPARLPAWPPARPPARPPTRPPAYLLARPPARSPARPPARPPARKPAQPPARSPARPPTRKPARPLARKPVRPPARPPTPIPARTPARPPARTPAREAAMEKKQHAKYGRERRETTINIGKGHRNGAILCFVTRISPDGEGVMRVLDGEIVSIHDFQYVVRIEKRIVIHINQSTWTTIYHESHCSASAIARKWILTAAHCIKMDTSIITNVTYFEVNDFNASETYVVVYGTMYGGPNPNNTISKILKAFIPTSYFVSYRSNLIVNDDVGLLMTEPIYLATYGRISALDVPSLYGREVTVLGSGVMGSNKRTKFDETLSGNMPIQYLKGMVARCHRKGVENRLCIMRRCGDTGMICGGDSGGPVLHISGIIGLNSVVYKSCSHAQDNHKDPILVGFSPVAPLLKWITDMIQNV